MGDINYHSVAEIHIRHKRNAKNVNKKSNVSEIISKEDVKREVKLAMINLACVAHCPKLESGEDEEGLVPQGNMNQSGLRDHKDQVDLKEIRGLLDLEAIKALKDRRAILVNPSQLLQLCYPRCPW